jgi:hypothetical protein
MADAPKNIASLADPTNVPAPDLRAPPLHRQTSRQVHILRSMKSKENNHERAINYLLTGYLPPRP